MSTVTFDTLKYTKELEKSGVAPEQAEAQANALNKALADALDTQLATKGDIAEVKADMRESQLRINAQLLVIKWMLALVIITTVIPALKSLFA